MRKSSLRLDLLFLATIFLSPWCRCAGYLPAAIARSSDSSESRSGVPTYTLEQAILTALRQNADILRRSRRDRADQRALHPDARRILPRVDVRATSRTPIPICRWTMEASPSRRDPSAFSNFTGVERAYNVRFEATQVIFAGGRDRFANSRGRFHPGRELLFVSKCGRSGGRDDAAAVLSDSAESGARRRAGGIGQAASRASWRISRIDLMPARCRVSTFCKRRWRSRISIRS